MDASRLNCSSLSSVPSRDTPSATAAVMYLATVSRDNPVPEAMRLWLSPARQRRMTSDISTLSTPCTPSLHLAMKCLNFRRFGPQNGWMFLNKWPNDPDYSSHFW